MTTTVQCATGTLAPYQPNVNAPWNKTRVHHAYLRMGFGATKAQLEAGILKTPSALIDELLQSAVTAAAPPPPTWRYWTRADYPVSTDQEFNEEVSKQYLEWGKATWRMMHEQPLRGKLWLFWHNHFVTRAESYYCPSHLHAYFQTLYDHSLGNFKDFVKDMGKTTAMLLFLNGYESTKFNPNENYARELYELFTLGHDNGYTQTDIIETSRALTGYNYATAYCAAIQFTPLTFDSGSKTIFGKTGNWNYDDVHDLLFTERAVQVSTFISTKLYQYFVGPQVDMNIVDGLAATFRQNNWEILPVLRQLFKSEHFFDEANQLVLIKSPVEWVLQTYAVSGLPYDFTNKFGYETLLNQHWYATVLGQELYNPIDVAGWKGDRTWINASYLTGRWQFFDWIIYDLYDVHQDKIISWLKDITNNSKSPEYIVSVLVELFLPKGFEKQEEFDRAVVIFKNNIPQVYFDTGLWNLDYEFAAYQAYLALRYITRFPEAQLN